jgi:alpha-D-ribose 1-methylphosphonate 5-triphosphate synthase subunit PhnH
MQVCLKPEDTVAAPVGVVICGERCLQDVFHTVTHPGQMVEVEDPVPAPGPLNQASATLCAAMLGRETPLWTDLHWRSTACYWLQYDCQSSIVSEPCMAKYAMIAHPKSMPALTEFRLGGSDVGKPPTTLMIQIAEFEPIFAPTRANRFRSRPVPFFPVGLPDDFWAQRVSLMRADPRGIDIVFTHGDQMMFLPGNHRINA